MAKQDDKIEIPFHTFDKDAEKAVVYGDLPHWLQAETLCFITWRTWDSIPADVLQKWLKKRDSWLKQHGVPVADTSLRVPPGQLAPALQREYLRRSAVGWNRMLDRCFGACVLSQPELAHTVANALHHTDGSKFQLYDFVIMPNHVHLIAAFPTLESQLDVCRNWKHYTSTMLNRLLGKKGRFWQTESFDHLIRSEAQFYRFRRYIAGNPLKARLHDGEYIHYSKVLTP